ncbi:MAG: amidohydrolase [Clostridia bacterium]|nr:amidohydrolase [Clostridia bacterium]MBQ2691858.1 amidohydrolase [Clostridia bacterium]MBQ5812810.1 amidohydrolase [Clostridia bacterium]
MIGSIAIEKIRNEKETFIDLAQKMWDNPEVGYNEVKACAWTAEVLEKYGFEVEVGAYDLPTCVVGRWGSGHPVIGLLGELDALPGMSQKLQTTKEPVVVGGAGQGCGHNLLNVACLAAAVGMKAEMEAKNLPGTVVFYGCPAEELLTGKVFMARNGAFKDLDCAFAWHGGKMNSVGLGGGNGLNSATFHFKGRTAHAGGDPYNGRSALDACEIMSVGANYLREHVTGDIRIHYVYKEAGTAPNIVPDKASVWYYVRGMNRKNIEETYARLVKCAEGAAHMTETELEIEFHGGCYNGMANEYMARMTHALMEEMEKPQWTEEELAFAHELNNNSDQYATMKANGQLEGCPIHDGVAPLVKRMGGGGSTDVADVQHIVPCIGVNTATCNLAAPGHSWQITACAGMGIGYKGMLFGAEVVAAAAIKMIEEPEHLEAAKKEFEEMIKIEPYNCPIPMDIPVPQPQK